MDCNLCFWNIFVTVLAMCFTVTLNTFLLYSQSMVLGDFLRRTATEACQASKLSYPVCH